MTGYVRVDTGNNIADGNVISATDLDNEFDGVVAAFNASTGHTHGGGVGEGAPVTKIGPTNDVTVSASLLAPKTTNTVDLGSSLLKYKDLYLAGVATLGAGAVLNTPASITLTNATGLPISTGVSGLGTSVATFLATPSSANLRAAVTDETGTGALVFANSPTLVTPILGTPTSVTLTNATGLPIATGVSGLGTGVATALAVNVGSAGAPVLFNGALGTPSSGTVTNLTGTASININGTVGATTANTGAFTTLAASGTTTLSGNQVISVTDNTNAALRITQLGTGNALLVEDSTNPDSTPFVIATDGKVVVGSTTAPTISGVPQFQVAGVATAASSQVGFSRWDNSASSSAIQFAKSRSGVIGTQGVVSSGDAFGQIQFYGDDGTAFVQGAIITAAVDGTPGLNDMPGRLVFSTTADGAATPTERMRIDSAGRLYLGTTSASAAGIKNSWPITGAVTAYGQLSTGTVQPDVTSSATGYYSNLSIAAASTLPSLYHFRAQAGTIGAGSTIANQYGFYIGSGFTEGTNNYGFHSNIAAGTGRYNFYAAGTADNYFAGKVGIGDSTPSVSLDIAATDAIRIPVGTTGERPTGVNGYLRFNTTTTEFEGYNGTAWASVGGSAISNDTSTATNLYPLFAAATTGTAASVYTSNAQYLFKPSTGELSVKAPRASNGIVVNSATISENYTIATGDNGMSAGPVSVASGITVTVSSGSVWTVV